MIIYQISSTPNIYDNIPTTHIYPIYTQIYTPYIPKYPNTKYPIYMIIYPYSAKAAGAYAKVNRPGPHVRTYIHYVYMYVYIYI